MIIIIIIVNIFMSSPSLSVNLIRHQGECECEWEYDFFLFILSPMADKNPDSKAAASIEYVTFSSALPISLQLLPIRPVCQYAITKQTSQRHQKMLIDDGHS